MSPARAMTARRVKRVLVRWQLIHGSLTPVYRVTELTRETT